MSKRLIPALAAASLAALAGCTSGSGTPPPAQAPAQALRTGSPADETACEIAVAKAANNGDTVVISSEFSQANTVVIVGLGDAKAKWRCLVSGGKVAEVTSMTNEGAL